jgi:hypothetical protein
MKAKKKANLLVLGDDVLEEGRLDLTVVPLLLEVDTVHLLSLNAGRDIAWIDLHPLICILSVSRIRWEHSPEEHSISLPSSSSADRALHLCTQVQ